MPMEEDSDLCGTNEDGSLNNEYCTYCYQEGEFQQDVTMEGMIEICLEYLPEFDKNMTPETARKMMREFFPTLKRWR